ncbi:hypothetical protein C1N53_12585 [Pontibacter sp. SGAir0037]|nr:hypothetical protein C1N53_12585 [Pontibacter sp. SGAir0037]
MDMHTLEQRISEVMLSYKRGELHLSDAVKRIITFAVVPPLLEAQEHNSRQAAKNVIEITT